MKRTLVTITLYLFISCFSISFPYYIHAQVPFNKVYNFAIPDTVFSTQISNCVTDSNYFLCAGNTLTDSVTTLNSYIAEFDYTGHVLWKKNILFPGQYNAVQGNAPLIEIPNKEYVLSGCVIDTTSRKDTVWVYHPFLYYFNSKGDSIRYTVKTDPFTSIIPSAITYTKQGRIIVAGTRYFKTLEAYSNGGYYNDSSGLYIAMYDTLGRIIWEQNYYIYVRPNINFGDFKPFKAIPTPQGGAVIGGYGWISSLGTYSHFLLKIDSAGNIEWLRNYATNNYAVPIEIDIAYAKEGGYFFATVKSTIKSNYGIGNSLLYYGKIMENGDTIWTKTFIKLPSQSYDTYGIVEGEHKELLLTGGMYYNSYSHPSLIITDSTGKVKSYREYTYIKGDSGRDLQSLYSTNITPQNKLLLSGTVLSNAKTEWDTTGTLGWVVMTDSVGCLKPGCQVVDTIWSNNLAAQNIHTNITHTLNIYPNPADKNFTLYTGTPGDYTICVYNMTGREVLKKTGITTTNSQIDVSALPTGMYVVKVRDTNNTSLSPIVSKLVVAR